MAGLTGGPTQEEVLAVALHKLELEPGDRVLDLGCGTGRVSIAAAARAAEVVAIDRRPEAIVYAAQKAQEADVDTIRFIEGEAADLLPGLGYFDAAFVGGSRDLSTLLGLLANQVRRRIVVNAVLVETLHSALGRMNELGIYEEAVHVSCSRAVPLAGSVFFQPMNPVFVIVGRGRCS